MAFSRWWGKKQWTPLSAVQTIRRALGQAVLPDAQDGDVVERGEQEGGVPDLVAQFLKDPLAGQQQWVCQADLQVHLDDLRAKGVMAVAECGE
ncbi:hypothetical protein [Arthrobacter sp. NPDC093139]|uniref:hypothetical protein n=1 Tax=Arthrobacter sp. NPDC093139 TaxID=3363945 RepID=UPI003805B7A5